MINPNDSDSPQAARALLVFDEAQWLPSPFHTKRLPREVSSLEVVGGPCLIAKLIREFKEALDVNLTDL